MSEKKRGLFVGLATLDLVYRVEKVPAIDEKIVALSQEVVGGGPALNAAVTFAALGGEATLLTSLGSHVLADAVKADLSKHGVTLQDMTPDLIEPPVCATILIKDGTGERSVISAGAASSEVLPPPHAELKNLVAKQDVVLLDGHHPRVAADAVLTAQDHNKLTILDAGSWKPTLQNLLPFIDCAIASSRFTTPTASMEGNQRERSLALLKELRDRTRSGYNAVTNGAEEINYSYREGNRRVMPRSVYAVDTLGAGDVFHGAYAYCMAHGGRETWDQHSLSVTAGSQIASMKVTFVGQRGWLLDKQFLDLKRVLNKSLTTGAFISDTLDFVRHALDSLMAKLHGRTDESATCWSGSLVKDFALPVRTSLARCS